MGRRKGSNTDRHVCIHSFQTRASEQEKQTFSTLFFCWSHNPVATFGLCLLAQCYDLSAKLILKFAEVDVTVLSSILAEKAVDMNCACTSRLDS